MDERLKIHELDAWFPEEVAREPGCQHLRRCFGCGVCTATCPVSVVQPAFSPSLMIRQILWGLKAQLLASPLIWQCAACARCSFQCPQDVRFLDIIQALRRLAVREGYVSAAQARRLAEAEAALADLRRRTLAALIPASAEPPEIMELMRRLLTAPDDPGD